MIWFRSKEEKEKVKQQKEKDNGYKYAAVLLLKGVSPKTIYIDVECANHFGDYSDFDRGVEEALNDWKKKTDEEYDYMGELGI